MKTHEMMSELASVAYLAALCVREQIKLKNAVMYPDFSLLRVSTDWGDLASVANIDALCTREQK